MIISREGLCRAKYTQMATFMRIDIIATRHELAACMTPRMNERLRKYEEYNYRLDRLEQAIAKHPRVVDTVPPEGARFVDLFSVHTTLIDILLRITAVPRLTPLDPCDTPALWHTPRAAIVNDDALHALYVRYRDAADRYRDAMSDDPPATPRFLPLVTAVAGIMLGGTIDPDESHTGHPLRPEPLDDAGSARVAGGP